MQRGALLRRMRDFSTTNLHPEIGLTVGTMPPTAVARTEAFAGRDVVWLPFGESYYAGVNADRENDKSFSFRGNAAASVNQHETAVHDDPDHYAR